MALFSNTLRLTVNGGSMVRKETAPFENPWLSAIDSTEKKLTRYASFALLHPVSETPCSVWLARYPRAPFAQKRLPRANDWLCVRNAQRSPLKALPEEEYQQLMPTLARINQRLAAKKSAITATHCPDESVEVALRAVRKLRAGRLKQ
ncbi:MAG: hypothetical protein MIK82_21305 [Pantoea piersonii]|jgi:hypothetical protein|nr:hypothetical protein [Pantoea sp. UBA4389]